ncbi:hypothetical protein [Bradyrhizobium sp. WSM1743]|uniref:hypothetical protein n=1 Tax=Bradyrhizobium sp. WSM1743 TaxID=318996 RepID=UPI00041BCF44|nr:hypothetical protein [Bradyrhizobium sp. WSM1743]
MARPPQGDQAGLGSASAEQPEQPLVPLSLPNLGKRTKRTNIVALLRKLIEALWRYSPPAHSKQATMKAHVTCGAARRARAG